MSTSYPTDSISCRDRSSARRCRLLPSCVPPSVSLVPRHPRLLQVGPPETHTPHWHASGRRSPRSFHACVRTAALRWRGARCRRRDGAGRASRRRGGVAGATPAQIWETCGGEETETKALRVFFFPLRFDPTRDWRWRGAFVCAGMWMAVWQSSIFYQIFIFKIVL